MSQDAFLAPPAHLGPPADHHAGSLRLFQGIPGIERATNGRLWATWYAGKGPAEDHLNYVVLKSSLDGHTWSEPSLIIDPDDEGPVRAFDPCLWTDSVGRLWLFWSHGYNKHADKRAGVWAIRTDNAAVANPGWSPPKRLCDGIMMNKPIVTRDGSWLLPVARWWTEGSAGIVASDDEGATWTRRGAANVPDADHRDCDEHMVVERADGSLWMLVRTKYGIGESTSSDGGTSWSDVSPSPIGHTTSRFFIRRLRSGRLLLVKHGALDVRGPRCDLTAFVSDDDGTSWSDGMLLDPREKVSYPDAVEDDRGTIHLIYDYDRKGAREILLHTFTEEEILQGGGEIGREPSVVDRAG